jgi:nickel-type superoxide dismutase maturation protease
VLVEGFSLTMIAVVVIGDSMWPTLRDGDTFDAVSYTNQVINEGDIVVFSDPTHPSRICVKRVVHVKQDGLFVEGDNPDPTASTDSHNYGLVSYDLLIGMKR